MPTQRRGSEIEQNPIRYKNLVTDIENQLLDEGMRRPEVQELIGPLKGFQQPADSQVIDFWRYQSDGLAVFRSPERFVSYRLPYAFDELAVVGDHFHVKPLIPLLSDNTRFCVLAIDSRSAW
jgi:hypothetical protein